MDEKPTVAVMANDKKSCNADCEHCFIPYSGSRSPEETLEIVIQLQDQGFDVNVTGSELLVNLDYLEAVKQSDQDWIFTNGLVFIKNPGIFNLLKENNIKTLHFSAHFGIYDDLNSVPTSLVEKVVKEAVDRGFETRIATTITSSNYRDVVEMCQQAYDWGAERIMFIRYIPTGNKILPTENILKPGEISDFFNLVQEARESYSEDDVRIELHGTFGPRPGSKGEELAKNNCFCPAGKSKFVLTPDDKVYGCAFLLCTDPIGEYRNSKIMIDEDLLDNRRDTCLTYYLT